MGTLSMIDRKSLIKATFLYLVGNFVLCLIINLFYVLNTPGINEIGSIFFTTFAVISNNLMIYLILSLISFIVILIKPIKPVYYVINLIFIPLSHLLFLADLTIYRIFKFHINGLVINLFMTEGSWDSVHLGFVTILTFVVIVLLLFIGEYFFLRKAIGKDHKCISVKYIILIVVFIILTDKITYAVADMFGNTNITRLSKAFPLYQPLTIKRSMKKIFKIDMAEKTNISMSKKSGALNYPKHPMIKESNTQKPNIMIFVIDAWRFDMFSAENTPHLWNFGLESTVFTNHYSGGNASRFGGFSILYGLNAFYWQSILTQQRSSVFIDEIEKNDYLIKIISSTKLTYPEFRRSAFVNIPQFIEDELPGEDATTRDPEISKRLIQFIKSKPSKAFFTFCWYDAPHGPYSYPDNFEKFTPTKKTANYLTVTNNDLTLLKNSYRNAIYFDDVQIGKVIDELKLSGLLENTIVLVTADHGEEFREMGYYGHTSAFTKYQTKVPLIAYIPKKYTKDFQESRTISYLTSHSDIVPTLFKFMGYKNPYSDYSHGKFLFDGKGHEFVVSSGWSDASMIDKDNTIVFSLESYNASKFEIRDSLYNLEKDKNKVLRDKSTNLQKVMRSFGDFVK